MPLSLKQSSALWMVAGAAAMAAAVAVSVALKVHDVRAEAKSTFASRNALVARFLAQQRNKLEVMTLLFQERYRSATGLDGARIVRHGDPAVWEVRLALAAGENEGIGVASGEGPGPTDVLQQREMTAAAGMAPQIRSAFRYDTDIFRIYYLSARQALFLASPGALEHVHFAPALYDTAYWQAAAPQANPSRRMIIRGPYQDKGGRGMIVTFAQPVYDRDTFLGIVALDLGTATLRRLAGIGSSVGETMMLGAGDRLLAESPSLAAGTVLRPPLTGKLIDWHEDARHDLWLSSRLVKDDLWLVHRLPWHDLYLAAFRRSTDTWLIALMSVGLFALAYRLRRALGEVLRLTQVDPLTQALNRRGFEARATSTIALARRKRHRVALVIFDIDHFKKINDTHGHPEGDAVLRELGRRLNATLRKGDLFCRWGGEEFVAMLVLDDERQAHPVAERMRQEAQHTTIADTGRTITLSAGLVVMRAGESIEDAVARADHFLYRAKQGGRNRIVLDDAITEHQQDALTELES